MGFHVRLNCLSEYRNLSIKSAQPNKGALLVWRNQILNLLSFLLNLSYLTLLERPTPILGRLHYAWKCLELQG